MNGRGYSRVGPFDGFPSPKEADRTDAERNQRIELTVIRRYRITPKPTGERHTKTITDGEASRMHFKSSGVPEELCISIRSYHDAGGDERCERLPSRFFPQLTQDPIVDLAQV